MRGDFARAVSENNFFAQRRVDPNDCGIVFVTFDILAIVIHRPDTKYAGVVRRVRRRSQDTRIAPAHNLERGIGVGNVVMWKHEKLTETA